ncbi:MAG: carboxylesterase family protein, partial [Pedococcus sp.]
MRNEVSVTGGVVRGDMEAGLAVFRGIPYAALPVRFGAPQPAAAWSGVREATRFGPAPPQSGAFGMDALAEEGDDWLTVNVWSPDLRGGLPVMVWIQGGGYGFGWSGLPEYDGSNLAHGAVVVVTFNYRVGLEGFGYVEGTPANRGLLDQVAALEWVQHNIGAFGG